VEAEGFAPESCTKYYVRVKVRDGQEESGFCEAAPFVMAILNQEEWQARFITAERPEDIDEVRAREALERAEEQMRQKQSLQEYKMSQASMARALTRLKGSHLKELK